MKIKSNGQLTDMYLVGSDTEYTFCTSSKGDYTVVFTPSNPMYYSGNYIVFSESFLPKKADDLPVSIEQCRKVFFSEFTKRYQVNSTCLSHAKFTWDTSENLLCDDIVSLMRADERFEIMQVLSKQGYSEVPQDIGYTFREIDGTDKEWEQLVKFKINMSDSSDAEHFQTPRYAFYRKQVEADKGKWFGAFDGEKLIGSLGIFTVPKNNNVIARFQEVDTLSDYRRQGVCSNLIRYALRQFSQNTIFCIITDVGSDAESIYRAVGFEPTEVLCGYCEIKTN